MKTIYSKFAAEEDWQELLTAFIEDIPDRLRSLDDAIAAGDAKRLTFLVHQLKGACGSYGYDEVTDLATQLEASLVASKQLDHIDRHLAALRSALQNMTSDIPACHSSMH